jgi:hypothetical protein
MAMTAEERARDCEIYGRVMQCLLGVGSELKTPYARGLHSWPRGQGGHAVEWAGGPRAIDVFVELEQMAADDQVTTLLSADDITRAPELDHFDGWVTFRARGVVFQLRPTD